MARFTSITKEDSVIIMQTDETEQSFKFDCAERKLYSFTGEQISTVSPILYKYAKNTSRGAVLFILALLAYIKDHNYCYMSRMEKFIPYLNMISTLDINRLPDTLPEEYIEWAKEYDVGISDITFKNFLVDQAEKTMPKDIAEILSILRGKYGKYNNCVVYHFIEMEEEDREIFCKIFKTTMKSFCWNFSGDMEDFMENIRRASPDKTNYFPINWKEYVDTNKDFAQNDAIIRRMKNKN